jgi:hypothetical protein
MSPVVHGVVGWGTGIASGLSPRDRALCFWAAVLPDLDAIGILFDRDFYLRAHHAWCHNFLFVAATGTLLWLGSTRRIRTLPVLMLAGLTHLLGDAIGTSWPMQILAPWGDGPWPAEPIASDEVIYGWVNPAAVVLSLIFVAVFAIWKSATPLEAAGVGLNRAFFSFLRARWKSLPCVRCSQPAIGSCAACDASLCNAHAAIRFWCRVLCPACDAP